MSEIGIKPMSHHFHMGQQVVAPESWDPRWRELVPNLPIGGCVYTIRGFETKGVSLGLYLEEIINPPCRCIALSGPIFQEPCFVAEGFRPVKKTSIELFQKLLAPTPELVS